jgi:hypothetical protein
MLCNGSELDKGLGPLRDLWKLCKISDYRTKERSAQKDAKITKILDQIPKLEPQIPPISQILTRLSGRAYGSFRGKTSGCC